MLYEVITIDILDGFAALDLRHDQAASSGIAKKLARLLDVLTVADEGNRQEIRS